MADRGVEVMRSRGCQRAFVAMMWAFLFLLPLPAVKAGPSVSLEILPDVIGWLLFAAALRTVRDLHPEVRALRRLALVGLVVCLPRLLRFHEAVPPWQHVYRLLQTGGAAVAIVFAWRLCRLVGDMAARAGRPSLKASAEFRFWLYTAGLVLLCSGNFLPDLSRRVFGEVHGLFIVGVLAAMFTYIAITISLMMGLMAGVARMCARLEREHQDAAGEGAEHAQEPPPP